MKETFTLAASPRVQLGRAVKPLRRAGKIPGVVYGHGVATRAIALDAKEFQKVLTAAGESTLVDLSIEGNTPVKVLIQDVDRHPLRGDVTHVDLHEVKMTEKLEADIELVFVGESAAVKTAGGILVHNLDAVRVRCLPGDLVSEFTLDLSALKNIGDMIRVADIPKPAAMEFLTKPEEILVIVNEPISEAELAALETKPVAGDVTAVKVAGEEKKKEKEAEAAEAEKSA